ncbi:hypothetical protein DRF75_03945 [Ehrlichia minasensis]|uniref:Uncharacterized protein n=1 Tax=Ehrlichia minasensis TaxID=1242993 RepID=A0A4V2BQM3_9RICK|nr:hypothetical protein [Ehrlichia minasensis]RZB12484.1 hypothetical protein DRF75_03945 [Ehrlichia minasensis]
MDIQKSLLITAAVFIALLVLLLFFVAYKYYVQSKNCNAYRSENTNLCKEKEEIEKVLHTKEERCKKLTSDMECKNKELQDLKGKISLSASEAIVFAKELGDISMQMESDVRLSASFKLKTLVSELAYKTSRMCKSIVSKDGDNYSRFAICANMLALERVMLNLISSVTRDSTPQPTALPSSYFNTFLQYNNVDCPTKKQ